MPDPRLHPLSAPPSGSDPTAASEPADLSSEASADTRSRRSDPQPTPSLSKRRETRQDVRKEALDAYAADLDAREAQLQIREARIRARERALDTQAQPVPTEATLPPTSNSETPFFSRALVDEIVSRVPMAIMVKDAEGVYRFANPEVCRILGRTEAEILGKTDVELFGDEVGGVIAGKEAEVRDSGLPSVYEETIYPEGEARYYRTVRAPWTDARGTVVATIGICRDVTPEVKATRRRIDSELTYRSIINEARDSIYVLDARGRFLEVNASTASMLQRTIDDLTGTSIADVLDPERHAPDIVSERLAAAFRGEPQRLELWVRRADGSTFPKDVRLQRGTYFGTPVVIGIGRDVTERYERERALRRSEQRLKQAQSIAHLGSWEWHVASGRITWSDETFRIYGYEPQAFQPTLQRYLSLMPASDRAQVRAKTEVALQQGYMESIEHRIRRPDGTTRVVEIHGQKIEVDGDTPVRVAGTILDVTERHEQKQQLRRAKEDAEEAVRLKSSMLANMSHEVRTPLTAIIGFSEVIEEEADASTRRFAQLIRESSYRLKNTLDSVLQLAKLEAGRRVERRDPFEVVALAQHIVEQESFHAAQKGVTLSFHSEIDVCTCHGDEIAVERILSNLIGNAIKFTPEPGWVEVRIVGSESSVMIEVEDSGIGMTPEFQRRMFEAFTQESEGRRRRHEGSGLGLAIVKQITDLLNGAIEVESVPGQGTRIAVFLPRDHADMMRSAAA